MRKKFIPAIIVFCCCIIIISFCSWGFYVHETATQLAVYQLPKHLRQFFFSNINSLTSNSIRPDKRRYTDKDENPKHFIDIEAYGENAIDNMPANWHAAVRKYSFDTLRKYGYVPYEIMYEDSLLVKHSNKKIQTAFCFMPMI